MGDQKIKHIQIWMAVSTQREALVLQQQVNKLQGNFTI